MDIELFLKATLIRHEAVDAQVRKIGQGILALWNDSRNGVARSNIVTAESEEWETAKRNPQWSDDFSVFGKAPLEEYVGRLNELHTKGTEFALRYVIGAYRECQRSEVPAVERHILSRR